MENGQCLHLIAMKMFCLLFLILCSLGLKAQTQTKPCVDSLILVDTIHVRGKVFDYEGKPVSNLSVTTRAIARFWAGARTNKDGEFLLIHAKPVDTILFHTMDNSIEVVNNKSRYLVIYMPRNINSITQDKPIAITAETSSIKKGTPVKLCITEVSFSSIEVWPKFPGGNKAFIKFIKDRLIYPQKAVNEHIEGEVEIQFKVDAQGKMVEFRVLKGIGYGCDDAVIKTLENMPKWTPGIANGRPVKIAYTVTINFALIKPK